MKTKSLIIIPAVLIICIGLFIGYISFSHAATTDNYTQTVGAWDVSACEYNVNGAPAKTIKVTVTTGDVVDFNFINDSGGVIDVVSNGNTQAIASGNQQVIKVGITKPTTQTVVIDAKSTPGCKTPVNTTISFIPPAGSMSCVLNSDQTAWLVTGSYNIPQPTVISLYDGPTIASSTAVDMGGFTVNSSLKDITGAGSFSGDVNFPSTLPTTTTEFYLNNGSSNKSPMLTSTACPVPPVQVTSTPPTTTTTPPPTTTTTKTTPPTKASSSSTTTPSTTTTPTPTTTTPSTTTTPTPTTTTPSTTTTSPVVATTSTPAPKSNKNGLYLLLIIVGFVVVVIVGTAFLRYRRLRNDY